MRRYLKEFLSDPRVIENQGALWQLILNGFILRVSAGVRDGTRILANALKKYSGDLELSLAAYNAGAGAVRSYGGIPPYAETQNYVRAVTSKAEAYA